MTPNSLTKIKSRWINKYSAEFDEKGTVEDFVHGRRDMFKLNVKPKSIWFVRHVLSEGISSSDECGGPEEGEILSDGDETHDKPTSDYHFESKSYQVSPVCDKVNISVVVDGHFETVCVDCNTAKGPFNGCNGPVFYEANMMGKGNGHCGNIATATESWEICYGNSNGSFHKYTSPEKCQSIRTDLNEYRNDRSPTQSQNIRSGFNSYGKYRRSSNGHGFRDVPYRYTSPKSDSKYNRSFNKFHSSKPHHKYGRRSDDFNRFNSPNCDLNKFDRGTDCFDTFYHRKPLLESRLISTVLTDFTNDTD